MIRKGMWKVVNDPGGTAKAAAIEGTEVAGKTGTAQAWREQNGRRIKDNNAWFIMFAPYEVPKYAICVCVQGGYSGGSTASPVAKRIMEQALALDNGYRVAVKPLEESTGHFDDVMVVSYGDQPNLAALTSEDEDLGTVSGPSDVIIDVRSSLTREGQVSVDQLVFTPDNFNAPQTVVVTESGTWLAGTAGGPAPCGGHEQHGHDDCGGGR